MDNEKRKHDDVGQDEQGDAANPLLDDGRLPDNGGSELEEESESRVEPSPSLVAKYVLFKEKNQPKANLVYYPSCALDVSPSFGFPDSHVVYVDIDEKCVAALTDAGFDAHCTSALEYNPGNVDILVLLNPAISPSAPSSHVAEGGFILCNDYHGTASDLRQDGQYEFVAIIRDGQTDQPIYDTDSLEDCWEEIDSEEEFKNAPFSWGGTSYIMAAPVVKAVTGKEENVLAEYKKILAQAVAEDNERRAKDLEGHKNDERDVVCWKHGDRQFVLQTQIAMKKGTVDDIFVFRKKEPAQP